MASVAAYTGGRRLLAAALSATRRNALTLVIGGALFWVAYDHGSYAVQGRNVVAIGIWWTLLVGVGLGVWSLSGVPRAALAAGGLLAAFAVWELASAAWAPSGETVLSDFNRSALYLGVFALTVVASRRTTVERWANAVALGILAVALLALASRLRPGLLPSGGIATVIPNARSRLSYPVGYWNALAALLALAVPLSLRAALSGRSSTLRAFMLAGIPILVGTIYLTSSRGGIIAAVVGVAVFVGVTDRRWSALAATAIAGAGSLVVVGLLVQRKALVDGATTGAARHQGATAAILIVAVCGATALLYWSLLRLRGLPSAPPIWAGRVLAVATVMVLVAGTLASHPIRRLDDFRKPPATGSTDNIDATSHLLTSAGSGRWQFWTAAGDEFVAHPLIGGGAGSFGRWWDRHGSFPYTVQDAHSLYLETLAELGLVGFALLAGMLGVGVASIGRRVRRGRGEERRTTAALAGSLAAFLLAAGIDWLWEVPAVTAVAFVLLGLLVGPATAIPPRPRLQELPFAPRQVAARQRLALGVAALAFGWLLICAQALPLLTELKIGDSQAAVDSGDPDAALSAARAAHALEPWAASPYLQLALVEEETGSIPAALVSIKSAISRDSTDWQLWLIAARLQVKSGQVRAAKTSIERALALNPRSRLLTRLVRSLA
jgi:O-antigen ligase